MKHRIMGKLRSRRGASITFALLLFLVCTVLCSVLVTAATAASGRMSRIAENDQRYYSVMSAAELMKDLIDGQPVSVVEVTKQEFTTDYTDGAAGTAIFDDTTKTTVNYLVDKPANEIRESDYVKSASAPFSSIQEIAAYKVYTADPETPRGTQVWMTGTSTPLQLSSDLESTLGLTFDPLKVNISAALTAEGKDGWTLTLTINDLSASASTIVMSFEADKNVSAASMTTDGAPEEVNTDGDGKVTYRITSTKTDTKITTVFWRLAEINIL